MGGLARRHRACLLWLDLICWEESTRRAPWPRITIHETRAQDRQEMWLREAERFASVIVVGQVSKRVRIRTPRGLEVGGW